MIRNPIGMTPIGSLTRPGAIRPTTSPSIRPQVGPIRPPVTLPTRTGRRFLRGNRF